MFLNSAPKNQEIVYIYIYVENNNIKINKYILYKKRFKSPFRSRDCLIRADEELT